ncbi:protein LURP-one-related 11-like [Aegilops tauschii subsp. strangulata]|nr:protein LURP-one-related 11-like [Aegilops tauschii subsp. strangulata]XP_044353923.1 protein LURP-one-related 11-like [Triticum aestivum]
MATARIQPLSAGQQHESAGGDQDQKKMVVYTVWMKSLVFNGHGCTIYGQNGRVAYRVDNYACTRSREVFVMDTAGKALIKLHLKKNFGFFETWQGYLCCNDDDDDDDTSSFQQEPWFSVRKEHRILNKDGRRHGSRAIVRVAADGKAYTIDGASRGSEYYRVSDSDARAVRRKRTASGVALGEDVLTLMMGPAADRLLVVGLVVVCGLLSRCI